MFKFKGSGLLNINATGAGVCSGALTAIADLLFTLWAFKAQLHGF
jgi:hypothetical protein